MARSRNIKPGFFSNDELVELPFEARLLFIGLWTIADRAGRLLDRPKKVKMDIFPGDDVNCEECLMKLATSGFILRYEARGIKAIQIVNWDKHQNPHVKEVQSRIPAPVEHQTGKVQAPETPGRAGLIPESGFQIPNSGFPPASQAAAVEIRHDDFDKVWSAYPKRPGANRADSLKSWNNSIKNGAAADEIIAGVLRYAAYVSAKKIEPQFIKQPARFFGPDEHYKSDWSVNTGAPSQNSKFHFSGVDRSGDRLAMDESMRRHNVMIPDSEIKFS